MMAGEPFFSIVVPTYARPARLAVCLRALADLDYPRDRFEVIVVDDGSEIPPMATVAGFRDRLDIRLLTKPHAGPAAARNMGAARARGTFLAFTDDDCTPATDWLRTLAGRFMAVPDHAVGGRTVNRLSANPYSAATQLLVDYVTTYYNPDPNEAHFSASSNLAVPTNLFREVGGFDETYPGPAGEDREFCDRWLRHGYRMVHAPEVVVHHAHPLTFLTFWRQHFGYGRGAFRFRLQCARHRGEGVRFEPLSFYRGLVAYPFSQAQGWRALVLATLVVIAQVANAAGFLWEATSTTKLIHTPVLKLRGKCRQIRR